jgi:lipopolysaccharide transport system permease protein
MKSLEKDVWLFEITPKKSFFNFNVKEIWRYRDLLFLFVKRDIITFYKQTILGPLWFIIQPLLTSVIQFVIFSKIAAIPSDGVPYFLFVLAGNIIWFYFSDSLKSISETFTANQNIFGKVYFPRIIMPLKVVFSNLLKFGIQFLFFLMVMLFYVYTGYNINPTLYVLFLPLILTFIAFLSMGIGMLISSLTVKYRDLNFVITFGISLFMYVTPIVYPTSLVLEKIDPKFHFLIYLNPLTGFLDFFKFAFLGSGTFNVLNLGYSLVFSIVIFVLGVMVFNKTEKSFIDII